jgi:formylglycine-generating enzyme required for sulfatase activity
MVYVPPGSFTMGSNDGAKNAKPAHKVTLTKGFFLDITEVSVGQYALCVQHTACTPANAATGPREYAAEWTPCCTANDPEKKDYPITCIDQAQAIAYCRFAAKRLPTEAEWEYAARGPDSHIYPWGDDEPAASHAHFGHGSKTCGKQTGPRQVGSIPAGKGPFGTLDQAGNVWEWTSDTYGTPYTADDQVDPIFKKPSDSFTVRGGSWDFSAPSLRSFARLGMKPTERTVSLGVRCAKNAE